MVIDRLLKSVLVISVIGISCSAAFALEKAVLKGQVLDINGKAVKGSEIFLYSTPDTRRPADFISPKTGNDGWFNVILPAGQYWAVARLRHGEKYGPLLISDKHSGEPLEVLIEPNEVFEQVFTVVNIREAARLVKKTRSDFIKISGKIVGKTGAPLKDMYIFANRGMELKEIPDYISSWTEDEGYYTLHLPEGRYFLGSASEFPPDFKNIMLKEIYVKSDQSGYNIIAYQPGRKTVNEIKQDK